MKNMKRVLALVLVFALSFTMMAFSATAFTDVATSTTGNANSIDPLNAMGVFKGYEDGTFKPDQTLTREQFAAIAYRLLTGDVSTGTLKAPTKFPDVKADRWSSGFVGFATEAKPEVIKGYTDGTFKPDNKLTVAEMGTMLVRVLGYEVTALSDGAARAFKLGLINSAVVNNTPATRGMAADAVYAAMGTNYLRDMLDGEKVADQPTLGFAIFKTLFEEDALVTKFEDGSEKGLYDLTLDKIGKITDVEISNPVALVGCNVNIAYTANTEFTKYDGVTLKTKVTSAKKIVSVTKADSNVEVTAKFADFDKDNGALITTQTVYNTFKVNGKTFKYGPTKDAQGNVIQEKDAPITLYIGDTLIEDVVNNAVTPAVTNTINAKDLEDYIMGSKADGTLTIIDNDDDGQVDYFKISDFTFLANIKSINSLTKDVTMKALTGDELIGNDKKLSAFNSEFDGVFSAFTGAQTLQTTAGEDKELDLGTITEAQIKAAVTASAVDGLSVLVKVGTDGIIYVSAPATVTGKITSLPVNNGDNVYIDGKTIPMMNKDYLKTANSDKSAFWSTSNNLGATYTATLNNNGAVISLKKGATASTVTQGNYAVISKVDTKLTDITASTGVGSIADQCVKIEILNAAGVATIYNTTVDSISTAAEGETPTAYDKLIAAKTNNTIFDLDFEDLFTTKGLFDQSKLQGAIDAAKPYNATTNAGGIKDATAPLISENYQFTPATLKLTSMADPIAKPSYLLKDGVTTVYVVTDSKDEDDANKIVTTIVAKTPSTLAAFKMDDGKTSIKHLSTIKDGTKIYVDQLVIYVNNSAEAAGADYKLGFYVSSNYVTENSTNVQVFTIKELNAAGELVEVVYKGATTSISAIANDESIDYLKGMIMYNVNADGKISEVVALKPFANGIFDDFVARGKDTADLKNLALVSIDNAWTGASSTHSYIELGGTDNGAVDGGTVVRIASDAKMFAISLNYDGSTGIKSVGEMTKVTNVTDIIKDTNDTEFTKAFVSYKKITGDTNTNYEITAIYFVEDIAFGK